MLPAKKNKDAPQLVLLSVLGAGLLCIVIAFAIRLAATNEVEQIPVEQLLQQYWQEQQREQLTESGQDKLPLQAAGSENVHSVNTVKPVNTVEPASPIVQGEETSASTLEQDNAADSDKIDINSASIEQLQQLKGIGPSKAKAIVEDREQKGRFKRIEDIKRVKGIGEKLYAGIQESIVASP